MNLVRRFMPVTAEYDGHRFLTKVKGRRAATPLLAALVVVELTDVVFAVDSVPAILAVSHEPYLVFASNAFAILGLRAMYFLLATARGRFHYLSTVSARCWCSSASRWRSLNGCTSTPISRSASSPRAHGGNRLE